MSLHNKDSEDRKGLNVPIFNELADSPSTRDGVSAIRSKLLAEIRAGNQESRNLMRALYEDLIARIATIGEQNS